MSFTALITGISVISSIILAVVILAVTVKDNVRFVTGDRKRFIEPFRLTSA